MGQVSLEYDLRVILKPVLDMLSVGETQKLINMFGSRWTTYFVAGDKVVSPGNSQDLVQDLVPVSIDDVIYDIDDTYPPEEVIDVLINSLNNCKPENYTFVMRATLNVVAPDLEQAKNTFVDKVVPQNVVQCKQTVYTDDVETVHFTKIEDALKALQELKKEYVVEEEQEDEYDFEF